MTKENEFGLSIRNARIAVSPVCNLDCVYCDNTRQRTTERPGAMEDFRRTPLETGTIDTKTYIEIIRSLYLTGFRGLTLTGGEPTLNKDWDIIVNKAREIGMSRVGLTTNATLINSYLEKKGHLPEGLTLLTVSLDTNDADRFKEITGQDKLEKILDGLRLVKKDRPDLIIRTNKVTLRSDLPYLLEYISFCDYSGFVDEINLLNLILKDPENKDFFEKEFISAQEVMEFLSHNSIWDFSMDEKYEFVAKTSNGVKIIIKDTNLTMRGDVCENCSIYCQEGFYTVRVATDGNITTCIDYEARLPFINGKKELENGTLVNSVDKLVQGFDNLKLEETLEYFFAKYNIKNNINKVKKDGLW